MSETKWTKGPWKVGLADEHEHQAAFGPDGYMVADCAIFGFGAAPSEDECTANAHLVAAAPDMAVALSAAPIMSMYHTARGFEADRLIADYEAWRVNARAALAKARGEQP